MSDDTQDLKQDKYYCHAFDIINGKGGGEYIYSLQEDYIYVYEDGHWKQLFLIEFMDRLDQAMPIITKYPLTIKKQIVENFKHKKYLRLEGFNTHPLINFQNYMYDPAGNNILAHKPEYYSTMRIPYSYDALAKCPLWVKTLGEIFENDGMKMELLQEFFGYCLSNDSEQKKGLLLLGETDTGKSTVLDTFREVIGDKNISNVPLEYLANPQYTPLLMNKTVNLDPDVNKNASDYEREFKIITGGKQEKVSCNQKHIPTFEFTPKCKLVLAANIFPKITDHSSAFYQRLMVIPFNRRFREDEKDRLLNEKLKPELSGIFNWMVEGLNRLKARGRFKDYDFARDAVQELEDENNPSNLFFEEHIEISMGSWVEKGELFKRYQEWCNKTNNYALSTPRFSVAVYKKFSLQTPKHGQDAHTGKRIWKNIKYVPFKSDIKAQEIVWEDVRTPAVAVLKTLSPTTIKADSQQGDDINWGE